MNVERANERPVKKFKKRSIVTGVILLLILTVLSVTLFTRIKTMANIKHIEGDFYVVDYEVDYNLDEVLEKGVSNVEELGKVISDNIFFGYQIEMNENAGGCSAFAVETPEGEKIMGRNFDYPKAGSLLVYCSPDNGYSSYSMVNLAHLGVTEEDGTMPDTLMGKISILASPYASVDGLNEKGLSVAVLELQTEPTEQDNGKKDIITTLAVRMLLDKCANTEEAIKMLDSYDMFSSAGMPYHFLISDATGNTVLVDWSENKMNVLDNTYATNFQLSPGDDYGVGIGHDRYDKLKETLEETNYVISSEDAMKLLEEVSVKWNGEWHTDWSLVYNMDDFSVDISSDMNYNNVYHFSDGISN